MKSLPFSWVLIAGTLASTLPAAAQQPPLSPEAEAAARKVQQAFPEKPVRTRGIRTRGASPGLTRSGSIIRSRGPVPTLVPVPPAADVSGPGTLNPQALPKPPPIDKEQVDQVLTSQDQARVDPVQSIAFDDILFDFDSATVKPASQEILHGIAEGLKQLPDRRFLIEGHTCDLGDESNPMHNVRLSCLRAEAVCGWLIHYGVPPAQVRPMGFGSQDPLLKPDPSLSKAANEPLRQQNRRAALRLLVE